MFCVLSTSDHNEEVNTVKKTRILSFLAALLMTISIMGTNGTQASAAGGCGNWELYRFDSAYCDEKDGCGFLWLKDTHKQKRYYRRNCVKPNNKLYTEVKSVVEDLGCC